MFSLIGALNKRMGNNREVGDLRRHRAHHGVIVLCNSRYEFNTSARHVLKI